MFAFAIWSRFSPPEFPNVSSAVSFCSYHASVLHISSSQCLKCEKLPAGLAGTIQAQIVDRNGRQRNKSRKVIAFLRRSPEAACKAPPRRRSLLAWPEAPARSRSLSSPLPCAASPELGPVPTTPNPQRGLRGAGANGNLPRGPPQESKMTGGVPSIRVRHRRAASWE